MESAREIFAVIRDLSRAVRLYQHDDVFCKDVTHIQFVILDLVAEKEGALELMDLHGMLAVDKSTTTRLVDPLVKKGYLMRTASLRDARGSRLEMTTIGEQIYDDIRSCLNETLHQLLGQIPSEKQPMVIESLKLFARSLEGCCRSDRCRS